MLTVSIDRRAETPVYEQVAAQLRRLVATGALQAGQALPPVRRLAAELGVGLNTVARAYRSLVVEGFLVTRDRASVEVAAPAGSGGPAPPLDLLEALRADLARLRQSGLSAAELERIVGEEIRALAKGPGEDRDE